MKQFQIPCFPISERTTFGELPDFVDGLIDALDEKTGSCPPLFIFEPHPDSKIPGHFPTVSEAPEQILVVALFREVREACFQALERVETREPKFQPSGALKQLKFKDSTPLKALFRQMSQLPLTVFSITMPDDGPDAVSFYFLRTPFTVSEFRREMHEPIK